ncbi:hypothetical protein [Burkholderia ubonensis]|uniref:hypothetical protein n=1 Tax=Burkholderia ubonensis TaxID=101571 RepID=UPI0014547B03|nr:hypothetical protein [Burkholderia ubonensis]VWB50871.1 hypothetical protein BUB20358_02315 [Burkholderia ubonensis]
MLSQFSALNALKNSGQWKRWSHYRAFMRDKADSLLNDRDSEENEASRLPTGESVRLAAVWVSELYTPSQIGGLFEGLSRLGWEHGLSRDDSIVAWTNDVRQGRSAGWVSLGMVTSSGRFGSERIAELPSGIGSAHPILMSLTPSITALVITFYMNDDTSRALDRPLREDYSTCYEEGPGLEWWNIAAYVLLGKKTRFSRTIHNPDSQRRRSVAACVSQIEAGCTAWVRRNLPGVFASGLRGGFFPTATLMVTEEVNPGTENLRPIRALEGLSIDRDFDAWVSDHWPCARLVLPGPYDDNDLRLTFACRRRDAFPETPGYVDPTSDGTIAYRANEMIRGLLSRWAITGMLDGYHEQLSRLRDKSAGARSYRPVRDLKQLRSLVRTQLYDVELSAHEITQFTKDVWYRVNIPNMRLMESRHGRQSNLVDSLRNAQHQRAAQVSRESELLKSVLSLSSDLSQTITNLRIQWFIVLLTLVSIGIAIAALYVAELALPK